LATPKGEEKKEVKSKVNKKRRGATIGGRGEDLFLKRTEETGGDAQATERMKIEGKG